MYCNRRQAGLWLIALLLFQGGELLGQERFVAVGYGGRRLVSDDGRRWEITAEWAQPGKDDSNNLMGLVFAQGRYVAVGGGGGGKSGGGHVLISADGKRWKEVWSAKGRINPIVYGEDDQGTGRFVVGGPRRRLYWSLDGETWREGAELDDRRCTHFRQAAYGNDRFVITGNHGGNSEAWVCTTRDGETVGKITFGIPGIRSIAFGNGRFVAVGKGTRISSVDGETWTVSDVEAGQMLAWVIFDGKVFLCGGGGAVFRSEDGLRWIPDDRRIRGNPKWTDGKRMISSSWPGKMFFSADAGKTWEQANEMTANGINRVVAGQPEGGG